jgi:hypothetical protein
LQDVEQDGGRNIVADFPSGISAFCEGSKIHWGITDVQAGVGVVRKLKLDGPRSRSISSIWSSAPDASAGAPERRVGPISRSVHREAGEWLTRFDDVRITQEALAESPGR